MRPRIAVLCSALTAFSVAAAPCVAGAAPHHNRGLTISATPNPINAGDGVLIYGQLNGTDTANKRIVLYHHISGSHQGYTKISQVRTDSHGFYEFNRAEGIVQTNRSWFARLAGAPAVHSRTVYERVSALVSLSADSTTGETRHPLRFTGHVTPGHAFERVLLQEQMGSSDDWKTLRAGRLGPGSHYAIAYRWRIPGEHLVRVVFPGDARNVRGASDPVTVTIEQTQTPGFTITTETPVISYGQSARITGTLNQKGTTSPEPSTAVTLCHRLLRTSTRICDAAGTTGADGSYGFTVKPVDNAWYYVQTALPPHRSTAGLFIGVKDVITLSASSTGGTVGKPDTFSGTVTPDKAGDVVYLQRKGADGEYHTIAATRVQSDSTYGFTHVFGTPGTKRFRTRILGDGSNLGDVSPPVTVTVALPPVATLPSAS